MKHKNEKNTVIEVRDLTRRFGDFIAVNNLSFDVEAGEIVGYLGPNGSGKTTTIRMLLGLLSPDSGYSKVLGYDSYRQTDEVRQRVGYMSQKFAIYDDLTVWENMQFYAGVYGITDKIAISGTLDHVGLLGHQKELTKDLSTGWRQRLALGIALVHSPRLLFLDEPTSGVDPNARRVFWDLIYGLAENGVTVLVTTHYMDEAEYCGRVGVMRDGKLLALDSPTNLKTNLIKGKVVEVFTPNLLGCLEWGATQKGIQRTVLAGDHLKMVLDENFHKRDLKDKMKEAGLEYDLIQTTEAGLEDVFTVLAK